MSTIVDKRKDRIFMKNNYSFIAEVFRKRRVMLGYSKRKLAAIVGISDTEVSRIEHGERENYNLVTLIRMCEVLKIDFIHLLVLAGYLPSNQIDNEDNITEMESLLDDDIAEDDNEDCDSCPLCEPLELIITLLSGVYE